MEPDPQSPHGFRVDAFGVGVAKCATTWMATCLAEHPEVTVSEPKEPKFFVPTWGFPDLEPNPRFLSDWGWYRSVFNHGDPDDLFVDYSTGLMWNGRKAADVLWEHNDEARLIVMLRDPVERLHSAYWHRRRHDNRDPPETFRGFAEIPEAQRRSRYFELLQPWFDVFPEDQIFVGLVRDVKEDPDQLFARVCRFLNVRDDRRPSSLRERQNPQTVKKPMLDALESMARTARKLGAGPILDLLNRSGLGSAVRSRGTVVTGRPDPDPNTVRWLRQQLLPDIQALEAFLDRDLGPWKGEGDPSIGPPPSRSQSSSSGEA